MKLAGPLTNLRGSMVVPASKSLTNRALVAAALAEGGSIGNPLDCEDTRLLGRALRNAGWELDWSAEKIHIGPRTARPGVVRVHLGNSGTGARLALALLSVVPGSFIVDGTPRLRQRPMGPLIDALRALGAEVPAAPNGLLPVSILGGSLEGGRITVRPEMSSQFVSALLMVAPYFRRGLTLEVEGPLPSAPYLRLTADVLKIFGARVRYTEDLRGWEVGPGGLTETCYEVEGDWSAAAFPLGAAAVAGGIVEVSRLNRQSAQGDRVICDILTRAGLQLSSSSWGVSASGGVNRPIRASLESCPDTFPLLAAVTACRLPGSRLEGLGNLAHKESDRLRAMVKNLEGLGARLETGVDWFEVVEPVRRSPDEVRAVSAFDDHRVAMAMAVTALAAGPLGLDKGSCVAKSFPDFWRQWRGLVGSGVVGPL